jgi:hypothetical protein
VLNLYYHLYRVCILLRKNLLIRVNKMSSLHTESLKHSMNLLSVFKPWLVKRARIVSVTDLVESCTTTISTQQHTIVITAMISVK